MAEAAGGSEPSGEDQVISFFGKKLDELKVIELKELLGQRGLKKSGRKNELRQRLQNDIATDASAGQVEGGKCDFTRKAIADICLDKEGASFIPDLPGYEQISCPLNRKIYSSDGVAFCEFINQTYDDAVHWQRNIFKLPSGKAGKAFIKLQTEWLARFNNKDGFMGIAMKVYMTLPMILLQRNSPHSKAKENASVLLRRIELLTNGDFDRLLNECREIQRNLKPRKSKGNVSITFAKLMLQGKTHAALRFLSDENNGGVLPLSDEVLDALREKHPSPAVIQPDSLLFGPIIDLRVIRFQVDEQNILAFARTSKGSAGPSGIDANSFIRILCSNQFKREGKDLREQIASFANRLATESLDPSCLETYVANRLIPIDKAPGIRPIGVGEILRRLVGKVLASDLKNDFKEASGPIQVCAGHIAGAEASIHAMQSIFEEDNTQGVLLIDASNAFNCLNRRVALHNFLIMYPRAAIVLINTYRIPSRLFLAGGGELLSQEGTTQGDPLAMPFYAVSISILIYSLRVEVESVKQVWYADDATAAGNLHSLLIFLNRLIIDGAKFGYIVNPSKSWLILKDSSDLSRAAELFKDLS